MRYRGPLGIVDAARFTSRIDEERYLGFFDGSVDEPFSEWLVQAVVDKKIELGAFGQFIIIHTPDGSLGAALGDWIVRTESGGLRVVPSHRFEHQYEEVS